MAFIEHDTSVVGNKHSTVRGKLHGLQHYYSSFLPWLDIQKYPKVKDLMRAVKRLQGGDTRDLREGITSIGILRYLASIKLTTEAGLVANVLYKV